MTKTKKRHSQYHHRGRPNSHIIQRLEWLIDVVNKVKDQDSFDMKLWGRRDPATSCGFVGCAVGWACLDERVRNSGLTMSVRKGGAPYTVGSIEEIPEENFALRPDYAEKVTGLHYSGWDAVSKWLGLPHKDASFLLAASSYGYSDVDDGSPSPYEVITRLGEAILMIRGGDMDENGLISTLMRGAEDLG